MIEILVLILLCRSIGRTLRVKGRRAGGYQLLTVCLWFGGEVAGAAMAAKLEMGLGGFYVTTLFGALCGAIVAYAIAVAVKPVPGFGEELGPVFE